LKLPLIRKDEFGVLLGIEEEEMIKPMESWNIWCPRLKGSFIKDIEFNNR
jgi:hypothetical protein